MKAFGIEIRKANTLGNLYADVDQTLRNNKILPNQVSRSVQVNTVAHALQRMLSSERHFDVCTIRNCAEVCQLCISIERMRVYSSIHCISWSEMLPDFRAQVVAMILDDFRPILNPSEETTAIQID